MFILQRGISNGAVKLLITRDVVIVISFRDN